MVNPIADIEAEKAVLGLALLDKESLLLVVERLKPEMFYDPRHEIVYKAMLALLNNTKPVDPMTVSSYLKDTGELQKIGGHSFVTQLGDTDGLPSNIEYYAGIVLEKWTRRNMIAACKKIVELARDEDGDLSQQVAEAEQLVFSLSQETVTTTIEPYGDIVTRRWKKLYETRKNKQVTGLKTGFIDLDAILGGLQPSDLIIIAARPGEGKTTLAQNIAENAAREGSKVAFFSLEMSKNAIIDRSVCSNAMIDGAQVRARALPEKEWIRALGVATELVNLPIWLDDDGGVTTLEIRSRARRLKAREGLDLVVVDYLQLIGDRPGFNETKNDLVGAMAKRMKAMAKELNVPVILLSQLNRGAERTRPTKAMLRDSGEIEQVADVIIFIYTPEEGKPLREIIIEKHKNGPTGVINLVFNKKYVRFENYAFYEEVPKPADAPW